MRAHRVLGDVQPGRDLVCAQMLVQQQEHLDLAGRKLSRDLLGHAAEAAAFANTIEQPAGDRAREGSFAAGDASQERRDALGRLALQEVAGRPGADRLEQVLLCPGGREYDDLAVGRRLANVGQRGQPVHARHRQVEQDQLRAEPTGLDDSLLAVGRLPDDVEAVLLQERGEGLTRERVIVGDQDAFHTTLIGSTAAAE